MEQPRLLISASFMEFAIKHELFNKEDIEDSRKTGSSERPPTDWEKIVFRGLDRLVQAGDITIATIRMTDVYLAGGVNLERKDAAYLLALWRKNYNKEGNYELIRLP